MSLAIEKAAKANHDLAELNRKFRGEVARFLLEDAVILDEYYSKKLLIKQTESLAFKDLSNGEKKLADFGAKTARAYCRHTHASNIEDSMRQLYQNSKKKLTALTKYEKFTEDWELSTLDLLKQTPLQYETAREKILEETRLRVGEFEVEVHHLRDVHAEKIVARFAAYEALADARATQYVVGDSLRVIRERGVLQVQRATEVMQVSGKKLVDKRNYVISFKENFTRKIRMAEKKQRETTDEVTRTSATYTRVYNAEHITDLASPEREE